MRKNARLRELYKFLDEMDKKHVLASIGLIIGETSKVQFSRNQHVEEEEIRQAQEIEAEVDHERRLIEFEAQEEEDYYLNEEDEDLLLDEATGEFVKSLSVQNSNAIESVETLIKRASTCRVHLTLYEGLSSQQINQIMRMRMRKLNVSYSNE